MEDNEEIKVRKSSNSPRKPPRPPSRVRIDESFLKSPSERPVPSPRRSNRQLPPLQSSIENVSETSVSKKKKKKAPSASSSEILQNGTEENNGSQTNFIPKKKKKKKKEEIQISNSILSYLGGIEEDVVDDKEPIAEFLQPEKSTIITSQPVDRLYIETNRSFRTEVKSKRAAEKLNEKLKSKQLPGTFTNWEQNSLDFAIKSQHMWQTFCLFFHGLTAGIGLWQIVIVYVFEHNDQQSFIDNYKILALPFQSLFYGLLVICLVSACDRYDVSNINKKFMLDAVTMKSGALSVVIYFICIVMHVSIVHIDDKMYLNNQTATLFNGTNEFSNEFSSWKVINILRGVAVILGWVLVSILPHADGLAENLSKGVDKILGKTTNPQIISTIS
ncbi:transmembrane protein 237-like [Argonauta hians]